MTFDILNKILEEEKKAQESVSDAQQSANELVRNAEAQAAEEERKAAISNRTLFQDIIDERRAAILSSLQEAKAMSNPDESAEIKAAEGRVNEAADFVFREVLNGNR